MDPLSLIGGIASASAIIGVITKTVHGLWSLQRKFNEADSTLSALISELSIIKAALLQIQDWTDYNREGLVQKELGDALDVALNGCKECLDLLGNDVRSMVGDSTRSGSELLLRTRAMWNESAMKEHQARLHNQINALQLLLQAVQVRTLAGQAAFIRQPKARQLIQQVKDDACSIRGTVRASRSTFGEVHHIEQRHVPDSSTTRTYAESSIGSPRLSRVDPEIIASNVYQNHGAAVIAKHKEQETAVHGLRPGEGLQPPPIVLMPSSHRTRLPQTRINTVDLVPSPSARRAIVDQPLTPGILTPNSASPFSDHYSPRTPVTLDGSAGGSPSPTGHRLPPTIITGAQHPYKSLVEQKPGLGARIKSNFTRALLSPRTPLTPSPSSPLSGTQLPLRKPNRGFDQSLDIREGDVSVQPLIHAAQLGLCMDVEALLDQHHDVNGRHGQSGRTALAVAAHCGHRAMCELLLSYNADIGATDHHEKTALHLAVDHSHTSIVALLLQYGARPQVRDRSQNSALHIAAMRGDVHIVTLLLDCGADSSAKNIEHQNPLHVAVMNGHLSVAEILSAKQKDIDVTGRNGMTALMLASAVGETEMVRLLLGKKASVKARCASGWQAIHYAAYNGQTDAIDQLLRRKTNVKTRTTDGCTPLMLSAMSSFPATDLLIRKDAQLNAQCANGKQALHYACEADSNAIIQLLLESGCSIEAEGQLRRRPVHIAAGVGSVDQLRLLLQRNAQVDVRDAAGERALCIAAANGHIEAMKTLIDHGAMLNVAFGGAAFSQDSALCIACKYGRLDAAVELILRGARVDERDTQAWQPLRYAVHYAWPDLVEMLLANGASLTAILHTQYALSSFGRFAFKPGVHDDRKARVEIILQLAEARERALGNTGSLKELEGSTQSGSALNSPVRAHSASPVDLRSNLRAQTAQSSTTRDCSIVRLPSGPESAPLSARHVSTPSNAWSTEPRLSPIADSTYHIQWPPQSQKSSQALRAPCSAEYYRTQPLVGSNSVPVQVTETGFASVQAHIPPSPTARQERENFRALRCVACTGMNRELPDLDCVKCRQNMFRVTRTQQYGQQMTNKFEQAGHSDVANVDQGFREIYEMDAAG